MLYVKPNMALYGLLKSPLLFYKTLRGELESMGFEVNPYDPCVANKTAKGSQLTKLWHVDDLKISHKKEDKVTHLFSVCMQHSLPHAPHRDLEAIPAPTFPNTDHM